MVLLICLHGDVEDDINAGGNFDHGDAPLPPWCHLGPQTLLLLQTSSGLQPWESLSREDFFEIVRFGNLLPVCLLIEGT